MAGQCDPLLGDPAVGFVAAGHNTFMTLSQSAFQAAQQAVSQLAAITIEPIIFQADFDVSGSLLPVHRPVAPDDPNIGYNPDAISDPGTPPGFNAQGIEIDEAPTFTTQEPIISLPPRPDAFSATDPGDPPPTVTPTVPTAPTLPTLQTPTLETLTLPTVPVVVIPAFDATRPEFTGTVPAENFTFTPEAYVSDLLTRIKAQVNSILDGNEALPAAIEQALRERAHGEVDKQEARDVQTVIDDFASRGFTEPNGLLNRKIEQVRQQSQDRRSQLSRDIYIQADTTARDMLKFAVSQGIALEQVLVNLHIEMQRLMLEQAKLALDAVIQIFNAKVSLFNAQMQAYGIDAQVFRDRIQAEMAKVELYRAQIEAEKVRGEINEQRVRIYESQQRALLAAVEVYKAQVDAVRAQAEINTAVIEAYRAKVQAFAERIRAYVAEWEGYRAAVDSQNALAQVYGTSAQAFGTRMTAYSTKANVLIENQRLRIAAHGAELAAWRGKLEKVLAEIQKERSRIESETQVFAGKVTLFQSQASVEQAVASENRLSFDSRVRRAESETNVQLRKAEQDINQLIQSTSLILRAHETVAQVSSNLAASAMSAVNYGASVSTSRSESRGCDTSFVYSGDAESA